MHRNALTRWDPLLTALRRAADTFLIEARLTFTSRRAIPVHNDPTAGVPPRVPELAKNDSRLFELLASVDVGVWYCDLPFDKLKWDARAKEHFGLPPDADVTIDLFYDRLHPADRDRTRQAIEAAIANHTEYNIEYRTVAAQGRTRWIRAIGRSFYDESGRPVRFDGVTVDITRQKDAEQQVEQSRRDLADVFDRITDGFAAFDRNWTYRFINTAACNLIGRSAAEVVGRNLLEIFPDIRNTPFWDGLQRAANEQTTVEVEGYYAPSEKWLSTRISPSTDGLAVYFRDVTEQKRAGALLGQHDAQFQLLADTIPQLAWMADPSGYIFWYNRRWYEYTGTTPKDMEGWGWQSVHDPKVLPSVLESWRQSIETGEPFDMVFPIRGANGIFRPFLTRVMPMRDAAGKVLRWFGTNTDISAQLESEAELRSSQDRLRAALEASATGTFRWDIETNALDWDENLDRLFGLQPGEAVRNLSSFIERVYPGDRPEVIARCERSALTGIDLDMEFRVVWPDGTMRWLYDRGKTFRDSTGRPSSMTGACVDITERKRVEQSLQERARITALGAEIGIALTTSNSMPEMLRMCTDAVVKHLDAAFARIWTLNADADTLELQASSGLYTHINGGHARVPVGKFKIGLIAEEREPHLTNDVLNDPRVGDREWARREGMVAFAGYPLIIENTLIGVAALFARHPLGPETLEALASIANSIALGTQRKRNDAALRESEAQNGHPQYGAGLCRDY